MTKLSNEMINCEATPFQLSLSRVSSISAPYSFQEFEPHIRKEEEDQNETTISSGN